MHRVPLHVIADSLLPFLEQHDIFSICYTMPGLFQQNGMWKTLIQRSSLFCSKPSKSDRKYRDFLRKRRQARDRWLGWNPRNIKTEKYVFDRLNMNNTQPKTDSEKIVVCRDRLPIRNGTMPLSFLEIYDIDCQYVGETPFFNLCEDFDFRDGKVLTTSLLINENKGNVQLWSTRTGQNIGIAEYRAKCAVFQDEASSFVYSSDGIMYRVDLNHPTPQGLFVSNFQKHTFQQIRLCKCTTKNRVVGFSEGNIFVADTRQQTCFSRIYHMKTGWSQACEAGDYKILYHDANSVREIDMRFDRETDLPLAQTHCLISQVLWTPDSLFVHVANHTLYDVKAKKWTKRVQLDEPGYKITSFHLTDKYLVYLTDGSHESVLSSICFY